MSVKGFRVYRCSGYLHTREIALTRSEAEETLCKGVRRGRTLGILDRDNARVHVPEGIRYSCGCPILGNSLESKPPTDIRVLDAPADCGGAAVDAWVC